ncbi:MAG TPA: O-methyltransferase [Mycobacteriales bacterium]|nr:O-methyltransferase [Mycobacteriales bacterium]
MTSERTWAEVDHFYARLLVPDDPALDDALATSAGAGLPVQQVSALQGRLLFVLATIVRANRILEIGTLGGYSTIHLARALAPGGRMVTLESSTRHAEVAAANLASAGLSDRVDVVVGEALDTLPRLAGTEFDLVFLDADKANNADYLRWAVRLAHPGTVIVADNVVRGGDVLDAGSIDPSVLGIRAFAEALGTDRRLVATAVQTVGAKGYDGFALAVVIDR